MNQTTVFDITAQVVEWRNLDCANLGPIGRSAVDVRRFHLAAVFWLML